MALLRNRRHGFVVSGRMAVDLSGRSRREYVSRLGDRRVVLSGSPGEIIEMLDRYVEAGLRYLVVYLGDVGREELLERMRTFMREIAPSFR